jgi:hypothetical protein
LFGSEKSVTVWAYLMYGETPTFAQPNSSYLIGLAEETHSAGLKTFADSCDWH